MLCARILSASLLLIFVIYSLARPTYSVYFSLPFSMSETTVPSEVVLDLPQTAGEPPLDETLSSLGLDALEEPSSSRRNQALDSINVLPTEPQDWGTLGKLTELQQEILDKFLIEANPDFIEAVRYTVETKQQAALRFLRARQFDAEKSKMLLEAANKKMVELKVRECYLNDGDTNANCDVEALVSWYPHTMYGYDKFKRPILWEWNGGMNVNAITQMTTKDNLIKYHLWTMEKVLDDAFSGGVKDSVPSDSSSSGGDDTNSDLSTISTCVVLDFNGFGVSNINSKTLDHCKTLVGIDNVVYPETLGKMFVINAPWIITKTWDIVKTWLDPRTQAKICILGSGPETTKKLLEVIPIEVLPKPYGGQGPDQIFFKKEGAVIAPVARGGNVTKKVLVPRGQALTVDSYLNEGTLDVLVTYQDVDTKATVSAHKSTMAPKSADQPARLLLKYPATADSEREFTVVWTNPARYYSRNLIYVTTLS